MFTQLCYASVAVTPFDEPSLQALLKQARKANAQRGITGILLYGGGHFVQLIEGEPQAVEALYARIVRDPRHQKVYELYREPVAAREFARWSMAFDRLDEVQPEFLSERSKARTLVTMFLEKLAQDPGDRTT